MGDSHETERTFRIDAVKALLRQREYGLIFVQNELDKLARSHPAAPAQTLGCFRRPRPPFTEATPAVSRSGYLRYTGQTKTDHVEPDIEKGNGSP